MRVAAVVSEFNPLHNGHKYLFDRIKENGFDAIVCVMSGNFVQRGEYAVLDKRIRAQTAIDAGADLVLSIPFPWSCSGAESFARAAVGIICSIGCIDGLCFGSETADKDLLSRCSELLSEISVDQIKLFQKNDPKLSYAQARQLYIKTVLGDECALMLSNPNDILALEYMKALQYFKSNIEAVPVKRFESSHDGSVVSSDICSSSYIRSKIINGDYHGIINYVPWKSGVSQTDFYSTDYHRFFYYLRGAILSRNPEELASFAENGGGFEYAVYKEMLVADDYYSLVENLKSRHLTDAKIRRALLNISLGVKKAHLNELPAFTEVLAFNERGKGILASCRNSSLIAILSKTANIKQCSDQAKEQFKFQRKAEIAFRALIKNMFMNNN